jgi:beta-lactamase regulating signal transducer with metallopeptidase domain/Leucine-rich repeat (LRR) protein
MSAYVHSVVSHLLAQTWQIALLATLVGLVTFVLRNRSAHLRYLLWLVVLAKCLVPPFLTVPLAVLPERPSTPSVVFADLREEPPAADIPIVAGGDPRPHQSTLALPSARESVALVWMAGVLLFWLWVGGRALRYTAWLRERRRPLSPGLWRSVQDPSLGFQFRKWPTIWLLDEISQPFVWGLLRGSVYLPADFVGVSSSDRQQSILAHELSHIARWDAGVNFLQVVAQAAYWFHPFVWWVNRKIRQEREKCCDEMAVAHLNTPPEHYTGAIVEALVAEHRSVHPIPSLAIVGSVRDIEERIRTMLRPGKTFRTRPSLMAATVALLIALVTIPAAFVLTARAQTPPASQTASPGATESEKAEQPRFPARTFNSHLAFEVWIRETYSPSTERQIGRTPSATPLEIPACELWGVQLSAPVKDWALLVRELNRNTVPYLGLHSFADSDLAHLADLVGLERLNLTGGQITDAGLQHLRDLTNLRGLMLANTQTTDAGLALLARLKGLQHLWLVNCPITDTGLVPLQNLTGLQDLALLMNTQITDAGLERIGGLTGLRFLYLVGNQFTDAGFARLKGLTALRELSLPATRVTDAGLALLAGLPGLEGLTLQSTRITDAGLERLKGLTRLRSLDLSSTQVTDAGLAHLQHLIGLQRLVLGKTRITDAGLEYLTGLVRLQQLDLTGTQVTNAGVQQLQRALPNSRIQRDPPQSRSQSVDKPATASQKTEPPRYAARTFDSPPALDVAYVPVTAAGGWMRVGQTPSVAPLEIPMCRVWSVSPTGPVTDWGLLVRELNQNQVPWLTLSSATDSDLAQVAQCTGLGTLMVANGQITDAGLEYLRSATALQGLYLYGKLPITDAGLAHLKGLTKWQ